MVTESLFLSRIQYPDSSLPFGGKQLIAVLTILILLHVAFCWPLADPSCPQCTASILVECQEDVKETSSFHWEICVLPLFFHFQNFMSLFPVTLALPKSFFWCLKPVSLQLFISILVYLRRAGGCLGKTCLDVHLSQCNPPISTGTFPPVLPTFGQFAEPSCSWFLKYF